MNKSVTETSSNPATLTTANKHFFDIKQILKLNNDPTWKFNYLTKQALVAEDTQPKF